MGATLCNPPPEKEVEYEEYKTSSEPQSWIKALVRKQKKKEREKRERYRLALMAEMPDEENPILKARKLEV